MSPPYNPTKSADIHVATIATVVHLSGTCTRETRSSLWDWLEGFSCIVGAMAASHAHSQA